MKTKHSFLAGIGLLTSLGIGLSLPAKALAQQVACNQYGQCFYIQVVCNQYGQCFRRMIPVSTRGNSPANNNRSQPVYNCSYGACTYEQYVQDAPTRQQYQQRINEIIRNWNR
ncbi:hypothetical protein [Aerosakkonema funiforme]|uniref:hypothetical protein n=1 Tax=Aerosakkonema funiforme TaxID=1246630 RepID=UPI0035B7AB23